MILLILLLCLFLSQAYQTPSSENSVIARKYWTVSEQVDRNLLRQEVQDFCGDFPAFRLEEVNLKTTTGLEKRSSAVGKEIPITCQFLRSR